MADDTPRFWLAFSPGVVITDEQFGDAQFEQRTIGSVHLPSGRLVVCDALIARESRPLDLRLLPGSYDVDIAIAHFADDDQRIAAARIRLADAEPTQWGIALREGQDADTATEDDVLFNVDSGTAAFLSAEAATYLETALDRELTARIVAAMEPNYVHTRDWANVELDAGLNVIILSAGFGDGSYPVWLGFDDNDEVVCIVTEFGFLEDHLEE
jgi:hypothetical protein